jgi:hypothetical protein
MTGIVRTCTGRHVARDSPISVSQDFDVGTKLSSVGVEVCRVGKTVKYVKTVSVLNYAPQHEGVEVYLHIFLTSAVYEGAWLSSCPDRFIPRRKYPVFTGQDTAYRG